MLTLRKCARDALGYSSLYIETGTSLAFHIVVLVLLIGHLGRLQTGGMKGFHLAECLYYKQSNLTIYHYTGYRTWNFDTGCIYIYIFSIY